MLRSLRGPDGSVTMEYCSPEWHRLLEHNQLATFDALWQVGSRGWFEPPNSCRGGWSGVVRTTLVDPAHGETGIFVKLQENHVYRAWHNFFRPTATAEREFRNLLHCNAAGVPTLELVYFGQRTVGGRPHAILVTRELAGFQPLDAPNYNPIAGIPRPRRNHLIRNIAETVRRLHQQHFQHNCLYPKHVFVRESGNGEYEVRLIDLEKAKKRWRQKHLWLRDLGTLQRHAEHWSRTDRLRFFLAYRQESRLSDHSRRMLRTLLHQVRDKRSKPDAA